MHCNTDGSAEGVDWHTPAKWIYQAGDRSWAEMIVPYLICTHDWHVEATQQKKPIFVRRPGDRYFICLIGPTRSVVFEYHLASAQVGY